MRRGWREVLAILVVLAAATTLFDVAHGQDATNRTPITVEIGWSLPKPIGENLSLEGPRQDVVLDVEDGRVLDGVGWPWDADAQVNRPVAVDNGGWKLGSESTGRVRVSLEVSANSTLAIRRGDQRVRLPVLAFLEQPQTFPQPNGFTISVERLPWDVLDVDFGPGVTDGIVSPGTQVPVTIGYGILQPEAAEVVVRTTAVLRPIGGQGPVWEFEQREILPANQATPPTRLWTVPAPPQEGTYVLEVQAAWEPSAPRESSRLGRLIRRRRPPGAASSAIRRVTLAVLSTKPRSQPVVLTGAEPPPRSVEVDSFDLSRLRSSRFSTWGRSPTSSNGATWDLPPEVLSESFRREREKEWLRGFIGRTGTEPARLGPIEPTGLAWSAVALNVPHPNKPHRLTVTIADGDPSALGAVLVDPGNSERRPRILLDACGIGDGVSPQTVDWIVWPDATEPILVLLNRHETSEVIVGAVKMTELEPAATTETNVKATQTGRHLGVELTGPDALARFASTAEPGVEDALATAENLASYLATCGATFVIVPERLEERGLRRRLSGRLVQDSTGPDRLDMVTRVLARHGIALWLEPDLTHADAFPDLPPPTSPEAISQGLTRIGPTGEPDGDAYQPLHPRIRRAMIDRIVSIFATREGRPHYAGVLIRLGQGPTLLGTPETGLDDQTFSRFVNETFGPEIARTIPGLDEKDSDRVATRAKYVAGVGRMPWLTWRSKAVASLYSEINDAVRKAAPNAVVAIATPTLDDGPAGSEARRVDLAGLAPSLAWRSVGLDLEVWPTGPHSPILLRGASLASDGLARDLAAHPDLDKKLTTFHRRGFFLHESPISTAPKSNPSASAHPGGDDRLATHAVASFDAQWIILAATSVSGRETRIRRFSEVFRQTPAELGPAAEPVEGSHDSGVVIRKLAAGNGTSLQIVNDTPFTMRMAGVLGGNSSASVEDLGRKLKLAPSSVPGGRRLVLDLAPHALSVVRVEDASATFAKPTLFPPETVLTTMETRSQEISVQLASLNRGIANPLVEPPNAGFEQTPASATDVPGGWRLDETVAGTATISVDEANPHAGERSLRLEASRAPASVISGVFTPSEGSSLLVQAYLKADQDSSEVCVWIEGERSGRPFVRRSEAVVGTEWQRLIVRVSDLPSGGLDAASLRFETVSPGTLWIDDVRVLSEIAPKAVRLNAQRTLLAALQAYRERKYADFARLADSHWARHPGILGLIRRDRREETVAVDAKPAEETPAASALPSNRTLR